MQVKPEFLDKRIEKQLKCRKESFSEISLERRTLKIIGVIEIKNKIIGACSEDRKEENTEIDVQ